jgi:hypothetical protein
MEHTKEVMNLILRCNDNKLKLKTDGTLDMRYMYNRKYYHTMYKKYIIEINRSHNKVCNVDVNSNYRDEIINLSESDILAFRKN